MSVVETISRRALPNSPPQSGQHRSATVTGIASLTSADFGALRNRKDPCPGFRPGGFGSGLRLPFENGAAPPRRFSSSISACNRWFIHSTQFDDDLNQFFPAELFQLLQNPGCTRSFLKSRTFKSSYTLFSLRLR
jgi:hypothetical protein